MPLIWILDSSSVVQLKGTPLPIRPTILASLDEMVASGGLMYPAQTLGELKSYAPARALLSDLAYSWVVKHEAKACHPDRLEAEARLILGAHPDLIDPERTGGPDPADPYLIALAQKLRANGNDARIIIDDTRQINRKVSGAAIAGLLGVPSTVMRIFLRGQGFSY